MPAPALPTLLSVEGLTKRFHGSGAIAVDGVSLTLARGELMALLGPSGCGKTTTLRLIAGFERPDAGHVRLDDQDITTSPPERRGIGVVFQDYALFPHLDVMDNVMFGLRRLPRAERRRRAGEMLELVAMGECARRMPHQLSGGQQQRVALARTLATTPRLVLLDEPFSNLDAALRQETRREVRDMLKRAGSSVIVVTHDQEEALAFADRMAVMREGRIEQSGTPDAVYRYPRTEFVARFLGRSNILAGVARGLEAETVIGRLDINTSYTGSVSLAVRPEQITLTPCAGPCEAVVVGREFRGHDLLYWVQVGAVRLLALSGPDRMIAVGSPVRIATVEPAVVLGS